MKSHYHPFKSRHFCSHLELDDPPDCECDNTHDLHDTVCDWCKRHGREVKSDPGAICDESKSSSWNWAC